MKTLAIIGTGISGMGAAYVLKDRFDITFYEKNGYPGGHTNTVTVDEDGKPVYIDSGFMVYNEITYPNLTRLFKELGVPTKPTSMSFSVQHVPSGLEYCGTGLNGLFAQRKNLLNPRFIKMLLQMNRFNQEAPEILTDPKYASYNLDDYVREKGFGEDFFYKFLIPMSSAVWSTPPELMLQFPAVTLVRFFKNHGFLGLRGHYQWRTVDGGSRVYRDRILGFFKGKVLTGNGAKEIYRQNGKVVVEDQKGGKKTFDKALIACHADEALGILKDPTAPERELLGDFRYQKNRATLHTDKSVMPKTKRAWSSWNYRLDENKKGNLVPTIVYYMNSLQQVSKNKNYFVSINDSGLVDRKKILWEADYTHPVFDLKAIGAQAKLPQLNEEGPLYFSGSYFKYGFHEDGLTSSLDAARAIAQEEVWK